MAANQISYGRLREVIADMNLQMKTSPAFAILNHTRVNRFYQQNNQRIQILNNTQMKLIDKFVMKDEAGKHMTEQLDGKEVWKFASDQDKEDYLKELNEFLDITFTVHL